MATTFTLGLFNTRFGSLAIMMLTVTFQLEKNFLPKDESSLNGRNLPFNLPTFLLGLKENINL